jgi:hypothetical protein
MLVLNFHQLVTPSSPQLARALAFATSGWAPAAADVSATVPPMAGHAELLRTIIERDVARTTLPHINQHTMDKTADRPSCAMEAALDAHYEPHLHQLYVYLERTRDHAPAEEMPFGTFGRAHVASNCSTSAPTVPRPLSNEPSPEMLLQGVSCTSSTVRETFTGSPTWHPPPKCNLDGEWRRERYCAFSCFVYGLGYADDVDEARTTLMVQ